ncbi:MAG: pyridoxamine 5'-phosphate oxidase [Chloroflexi bacterium]|nr:pyridoxamine 5'-phosphate oxidase [Chloroflexota bacterium]
MASWQELTVTAPEFMERVRTCFDTHRHKLLATLRRDGFPRLSAIETIIGEGELWLGMMAGSRKALDLRRDPRLALHSASFDPDDARAAARGDAKLAGRALEIADPAVITRIVADEPQPLHLFRVEVSEVVLTRLGDPPDHLVIEFWSKGRGLQRFERR